MGIGTRLERGLDGIQRLEQAAGKERRSVSSRSMQFERAAYWVLLKGYIYPIGSNYRPTSPV